MFTNLTKKDCKQKLKIQHEDATVTNGIYLAASSKVAYTLKCERTG